MSKKEEILRKVAEEQTKEKMTARIYGEIEQEIIKIFETKEAREALTELGKTDKETWGLIKDSVIDLKEFIGYGGITRLKEGIAEQMELSLM